MTKIEIGARKTGHYYFGKVCSKHPELKGKRHVGSGCITCMALSRKESRQRRMFQQGTTTYLGRICAEHPELAGKRWTASDICVECFRLRRKEADRKRKEKHSTTTYFGSVCRNHPEFKGKRWTATNHCVECQRRKRYTVWKRPDPEVERIRIRILNALSRNSGIKAARTMELIGCSIEQLRQHLEDQFLPGMEWGNRKEWHVDHKRPLSSFNLSSPKQQRLAFHYSNLQPLWAKDNLSKGTRWRRRLIHGCP
jgi:hypothetical protein